MSKIILNFIDLEEPGHLFDPWTEGPQPVYLMLWEVKGEWHLCLASYQPGAISPRAHERVSEFWWRAEPFKAEAANTFMEKAALLVENYPDMAAEERSRVDEEIAFLVSQVDAAEIINGMSAAVFCDDFELFLDADGDDVGMYDSSAKSWVMTDVGTIRPNTTDKQLKALSVRVEALAEVQDVYVYDDAFSYLRGVRDGLASNVMAD